MSQWLLRRLSDGLAKWIAFVLLHREHERRVRAAVAIQGMVRGVLMRRAGAAMRATMLLIDMARRKREADELAERREREARAARQQWLREHGVSHDGVHFSRTRRRRKRGFGANASSWSVSSASSCSRTTTLKIQALETWRHYVTKVLPPAHFDVVAISRDVSGLRELLHRELEPEQHNLRRQSQQDPQQEQNHERQQSQKEQRQQQQPAPGHVSSARTVGTVPPWGPVSHREAKRRRRPSCEQRRALE